MSIIIGVTDSVLAWSAFYDEVIAFGSIYGHGGRGESYEDKWEVRSNTDIATINEEEEVWHKNNSQLSHSIYRQLEREADRDDVDVEECAVDIIQDFFEAEQNPPDEK